MANHAGAHMLNDVLCLLEEESFFATLGPEKTEKFIRRVADLGFYQDCQSYEILNGIGPRLGIYVMETESDGHRVVEASPIERVSSPEGATLVTIPLIRRGASPSPSREAW